MRPASRRFSIWYFAVVSGMESLEVISVRLFLLSASNWRISLAVWLAIALEIFWARSSPGSRITTLSAMHRRNYPFASDFQSKINLVNIGSATLCHGWFASPLSSRNAADLRDDLSGIYLRVCRSQHNPCRITRSGKESDTSFF